MSRHHSAAVGIDVVGGATLGYEPVSRQERSTRMRYVSTRGQAPVLPFEETMLSGLARDGGLYVPESMPALSPAEIAGLAGLSYEDAAYWVMRPFVGDCFTDGEFRAIICRAYAGFGHAARCPLVQIGPDDWVAPSPPKQKDSVLPARQAYSHSASVGRRVATELRAETLRMNPWQSLQLTFTTGCPRALEPKPPMIAIHWVSVTSVRPT